MLRQCCVSLSCFVLTDFFYSCLSQIRDWWINKSCCFPYRNTLSCKSNIVILVHSALCKGPFSRMLLCLITACTVLNSFSPRSAQSIAPKTTHRADRDGFESTVSCGCSHPALEFYKLVNRKEHCEKNNYFSYASGKKRPCPKVQPERVRKSAERCFLNLWLRK